MKRRLVLAAGAAAAASFTAPGRAQGTGIFAVNDGVSYRGMSADGLERYELLRKDLNKALGTHMTIQYVSGYNKLAEGLRNGAFDMAQVHPAHHAIRAIKTGDYQLAALSKSHLNYQASFLVRQESPLTSVAMLAGGKVYAPDADSITAWLARATVAEQIVAGKRPSFVSVRYQDAIRYAVENKLADAGVTASASEIRAWESAGHRVLAVSRSIPIKHFIVNRRFRSQLDAISTLLRAQRDTAKLSMPEGYVSFDEAVLVKAGDWLALGAA
jgi:ABC-type phosphate/phosphonate transport system substrate-binding protein